MNDTIVNKWSMGLAIFSFGFLSIGSFLFGATVTTSALRGLGGGVLFGASLWLTGLLVIEEKDATEDDPGDDPGVDEDLGQKSIKIDPEAVRKKFLEESAEINKKQSKEKNEQFKKEATPF
jgi:hypothetical protein